MPVIINLPQLTRHTLLVEGTLPARELQWERTDELLDWGGELSFRFTARRVGDVIHLEGNLAVDLACHCARCLRPFRQHLSLNPWVCEVPLEGEDAAIAHGDLVDLTPFLREDIVLALPQHPLCDSGCSGLSSAPPRANLESDANRPPGAGLSAWSDLDRLKL